ncbi:MAG: pyrimidine/purine nucleoside phosphorylase [Thermodesulfobacteriota bacterium]
MGPVQSVIATRVPREYEFNTDKREIMEIVSGDLEVLLPDENGWRAIKDGEQFEVPAQSNFNLKIKQTTDYCCSFVQ